MSKTLYLMRHGETLFNVQHKNQGWCDAPLTERGKEQARRAARYFTELAAQGDAESQPGAAARSSAVPARPDYFFSSTSERACDTLELVCQTAFGEVPPYERVKGLKEWNFGVYEGKDSFLNPKPPFGDFFVPFGGEGQAEFVNRLVTTLTSIMERPECQVVFAASHGAACANFSRAWAEQNVVQYHPGVKNCSIFRYEFNEADKSFSCVELFEPDLTGL